MGYKNTYQTITNKNLLIRMIFILLAVIPLIYYQEFYQHFYAYLTGNIITYVITKQWHIVILSILLFTAFLIPLSFRRKANWVERGLVGAFFVSLFIEMYGVPLTILLASKYFYPSNFITPGSSVDFKLLGVRFSMDLAMSYAALIMTIGTFLVIIGWLIGWPTLITLVFTPILIYKYIQVCQIEESEISNRIQAYQQYKKDVPFFI